MKVGIIVPGGMDAGGTERVIPVLLALIERVAAVHEVHVFALAPAPRTTTFALRGATVHAMGRGARSARAAAAILREHRRARFTLLHAFWAVPCGTVAALAGRTLGIPVLTHVAGGELISIPAVGYGGQRTARGRTAVHAALSSARRITAASRPILDELRTLGFAGSRLPLGVDTNAWPPLPPRPRDPSRPARLLAVGSLNAVKDPRMLLEAARFLARDGVAFTLDVAGEDTLNGVPRQWAHELGLDSSVRFHGFLPQQRLRPLFERADLLLHTALHEAGPVVVLEAAIAGVPAAGTHVGHLAEWTPDAAITASPGDARGLAAVVRVLLDDDARRLETARAARTRACTEDADFTARRVLDLYEELADG